MTACPNCGKPAPEGATHCETCGADLAAPPPAPHAPAAGMRSYAGTALAAGGIATQIAGASLVNLFYVGVGYFACSVAFRLSRAEEALLLEEDEIAPGPKALPALTRIAKRLAITGMALGIPLAAFAFWRGGITPR